MKSAQIIKLVLGMLAVAVCAQGAAIVEEQVTFPMHDGVALEAALIRPDDVGKHAAILVRTPYGRQQHLTEARFWAANGYAVLVQDTRGKFGSEGDYVPFAHEHDDGMATLDWITGQDWSDGNIGMFGSSYLAFCQLVLASSGHPALKSIIPISGWLQDDGPIRTGGANHIMLSLPWILHEESQTKRSMDDYDLEEMFEFLPLIDVFKSVGLDSKIWNEDFDFEHFKNYHAENIRIPALHISGWNDFVCGTALDVYRQAHGGPAGSLQKLIVGPWAHDQFWTTYTEVGDEDFGPESAMGLERLMKLALDWFDMTLKRPAAVSEWPDARVFVMGANQWKDYDSWPPSRVRHRKLFIGSVRGANSAAGDGTLSVDPLVQPGHDAYVFDPMSPVPTYGGANFHFLMHLVGVKDQREIEARDDVLVYTSAPLEEDMELAGPISAVLHVSTEGRDTDFTAKLVEVRLDGYARIIEEGIIRASYRNGTGERELLEPGEVYRVTVDLGSTAILIAKGHLVRLEVSSSNFPKYDRNPNTGEDPIKTRVLKTVTQRVYYGGETPSHVVLPVVERQERVTNRR
jgi:putative CocE/NonD family hydrolase